MIDYVSEKSVVAVIYVERVKAVGYETGWVEAVGNRKLVLDISFIPLAHKSASTESTMRSD